MKGKNTQEKRTRSHQRLIRFNDEENDYINAKVEASPFNNFQNFARILLITGEVHFTDYSELKALNYEVNRIGNNINQLAKLAHEFQEISPADIQKLQTQMTNLTALVSEQLTAAKKEERSL
ncbi:plasmid mobilization relaxosome protein MobC [Lactococcus lactis subsp. lactis]|uniref:plasmid mobilization relaxosome protein MobC n=1 Tax=Lactococcus lactis TaxID=1358 RepID=UPI0004E21C10|nr:plasmid mobilization relaxosome protein MobC [Lactococcus lactis]MBR8673897.1 plasmid mobilization relaxosome protein MobC [Lactococcus lactis subsp. lactis]MBR8676712.1 plasmid mobilization relaxosome protein MobC [Lactococcus lactis subsp. lactis]MBR8684198.1 plasmid mobilization relaxosome protein MobC [Lactococcus lactis subsp. lactis]OJH47255.1 mobilization protein [Lactococcus lactis subsp. lactis bv. diacetylactis]TRW69677.1 MobC family plasmid mobilization relaxosome protein [Lactoc